MSGLRLKRVERGQLEPRSGTAFELAAGDFLKVIDPEGEQVADLVCFGREERGEWLSSGRTFDYANTIQLTSGHDLYSNRSRPMLRILWDSVGKHDFLLTPCSPETFKLIYGLDEERPSCFGNLCRHLARFGVHPDQIPTTFNIFMNVEMNDDGSFRVEPPKSKAGDYVFFEAKMDLIVGLTACSAELSNNFRFKPIQFEIYRVDGDMDGGLIQMMA